MSEFKVVPRAVVPSIARRQSAEFAQVYAKLLEIDLEQVIEVSTTGRPDGENFKRGMQRMASSEGGYLIGWSRSEDFKTYFFWMENRP